METSDQLLTSSCMLSFLNHVRHHIEGNTMSLINFIDWLGAKNLCAGGVSPLFALLSLVFLLGSLCILQCRTPSFSLFSIYNIFLCAYQKKKEGF